MNASIVLVTYNRLEYTKKTINCLLNDQDEFDLYIWDNASIDGTKEYLMEEIKDSRIKEIYLSIENLGQTAAMNYFWAKCNTDLVGKLDNDILISPGWVKTISEAHKDIEMLGAVACWHFWEEDFNYEIAKKKIKKYGNHQILKHPFVGGTGFLLKRKTYLKMGPWEEGSPNIGTTSYFLKMALSGYINGWYYPLITQEHMDDPTSKHCIFKDDASLMKVYDITYTLRTNKIKSYNDRLKRRDYILSRILRGASDAKYYVGWRNKLHRYLPVFYNLLLKLDKN